MADDYNYDVFISYSHKDEDWADKVLRAILENAGLKVCIDYRDFPAGKPAIINMQEAAKTSKQTVLVLTQNWLDSEWTFFESIITGSKDPSGIQQRVIPLLCEEGIESKIPEFISVRTWVDFTRKDREAIAWKQLFTALGKPDASIPTTTPAEPEAKTSQNWHLAHPYPMPPNFTGRIAERKMLTNWLENDDENRLFILRALGGFGKSALAWHWLTHDVDAKQWPKVVWWSFYEGDASFENFLKEILDYLKIEVPPGQRQQVDALLKAMTAQKILLIMDGFERALRAYSSMTAAYQGDEEGKQEDNQRDCININAEIFLKNLCVLPNIKGKVLMTTRLTPLAVEQRGEFLSGCHEEELQAMQKEDAVAFYRLQGIRGTRAEIEAACEPYGYHPLSLRILAGLIANDREVPGDIAVAGKLDITDDVIQNKHHVLEVAYNTLSSEQKNLLSHIACFRSAITYDALKAISDKDFNGDLKILEHRGLLYWDKTTNKYDLHPIVRRYAYKSLTTAERASAHERLINYFEAAPKPKKVEKLQDLASVIELYFHMVKAGKFTGAAFLYHERIWKTLYYQLGAYQTQIELLTTLFPNGENKPPVVESDIAQTFFMNELANAYAVNGQPRRAIPLFDMHNNLEMKRKKKIKESLVPGLTNVASMAQIQVGALKEAERNLRRAISLCRKNQDELSSTVHQELGRLLSYRGAWKEAKQELSISTEYWKKTNDAQGLCMDKEYRALRNLLMSRAFPKSQIELLKLAIQFATQALDMADKDTKERYYHPSDYIRGDWLLGAAYRKNGDLNKAEETLSKAINSCRQINLVAFEADILLELACLRYNGKDHEVAKTLAEEALLITERSGYVLQGADVHLFLAQYALEQEKDNAKAKELAEKAKALAYCDGPPYYYKVAYEEAERMLENLSVG